MISKAWKVHSLSSKMKRPQSQSKLYSKTTVRLLALQACVPCVMDVTLWRWEQSRHSTGLFMSGRPVLRSTLLQPVMAALQLLRKKVPVPLFSLSIYSLHIRHFCPLFTQDNLSLVQSLTQRDPIVHVVSLCTCADTACGVSFLRSLISLFHMAQIHSTHFM